MDKTVAISHFIAPYETAILTLSLGYILDCSEESNESCFKKNHFEIIIISRMYVYMFMHVVQARIFACLQVHVMPQSMCGGHMTTLSSLIPPRVLGIEPRSCVASTFTPELPLWPPKDSEQLGFSPVLKTRYQIHCGHSTKIPPTCSPQTAEGSLSPMLRLKITSEGLSRAGFFQIAPDQPPHDLLAPGFWWQPWAFLC